MRFIRKICRSFLDWVNYEVDDECDFENHRSLSAEYTIHFTLYSASNGIILELKRQDTSSYKQKVTLHFLNTENLGSQIEKILLLEKLKG